MTPVTLCSELQPIHCTLCLHLTFEERLGRTRCTKMRKLFKWNGSEGSCNRCGSNPAQFNNARLEDLFHQHCTGFKPNARQANRDKLLLQDRLTPSRCPVPSKYHQFSAPRISLLCRKLNPRGLAENHWQSSTWPINLLYLSTMYYKEYANYLQEKKIGNSKILPATKHSDSS